MLGIILVLIYSLACWLALIALAIQIIIIFVKGDRDDKFFALCLTAAMLMLIVMMTIFGVGLLNFTLYWFN